MLITQSNKSFENLLRGLEISRTDHNHPRSKWRHASYYIGPVLFIFAACTLVMFIMTLRNELNHFGDTPAYDGPTIGEFFLNALLLSLPFQLLPLFHAQLDIPQACRLQRRFGCSYEDAYYISKNPKLRVLANRISDVNEFQMLVDAGRYHNELTRYLWVIETMPEQLEGFSNQHARVLLRTIGIQRALIESQTLRKPV